MIFNIRFILFIAPGNTQISNDFFYNFNIFQPISVELDDVVERWIVSYIIGYRLSMIHLILNLKKSVHSTVYPMNTTFILPEKTQKSQLKSSITYFLTDFKIVVFLLKLNICRWQFLYFNKKLKNNFALYFQRENAFIDLIKIRYYRL